MMSQQETFNKLRDHLLSQNCKSINDDGLCRYRASDGKKCAAGVFIPDYIYTKAMENKSIHHVIDRFDPKQLDITGDLNIMRTGQNIHDSYSTLVWERELQLLARRFNLVY